MRRLKTSASARKADSRIATPSQDQHPRRTERKLTFEARIRAGVAQRGAFPYLVSTTAMLALGAGVLARLTDKKDFDSYGDAIWWAVETLTTVGYGDIVPHTAWGRIIGVFVMILGVTFISFLTANVTSLFIRSDEGELEASRVARETEMRATLQRIEDRLAAIEARLPNE